MKTCSGCGRLNPDVAASCAKCGGVLVTAELPVARDLPMPAPAVMAAAPRRADPAPSRNAETHGAADTDGFDEEAWRAVIGPKHQDFYVERFRAMHDAGAGLRAGWHWPAFFVTWYWLLYRKVWGWAVLYAIGSYMVAVVGAMLLVASPAVGTLVALAYFLVPPMFATSIYYRKCRRLVERHREGVTRERYLGRLESAGGTGRAVFFAVLLFSAVFFTGVLAAVALPAYHDYTQRAKVSAAASFARVQAAAAAEEARTTGKYPFILGSTPPELRAVEGLAIDPQTGLIEMRLKLGPSGPAGSVFLAPDPAAASGWRCEVSPPLAKFEKYACGQR